MWAAGSLQPRTHTATASVDIDAPIDEVWATVRDYDRLHQWAPDMVALQRLDDVDGRPVYRMDADGDTWTFTIVEEDAPGSMVVDLEAASAVFGGRWTYDLEASELGTHVTITEEGWIEPPPFRLIMALTDGYDDTVEAHAQALKAHLEG